MRHIPEGFHADWLLRGVLPPPGEAPRQFASTRLNPRFFSGLYCPPAKRPHTARPILLVPLQARS